VSNRSPGRGLGDYSARILAPLLSYATNTYGEEAVAVEIASRGGDLAAARDTGRWLTHAEFEAAIGGVRSLCSDDSEFVRACSHQLRKAYGVFVFLVRATSNATIYRLMARTTSLVSRVSRYEVVSGGAASVGLRYVSERPESREMCLSRQAQLAGTPVACGLPQAQVEERACISRGDAACEYVVRWHAAPRWWQVAFGITAGIAAAFALRAAGITHVEAFTMLPTLGGLIAFAVDQWRANRENERNHVEITQSLQGLIEEAADARDEVLELTRRQEHWAELLEQQVEERTASLRDVVDGVRRMREARVQDIRGFSHDLRNPLTVLRSNLELVETKVSDPESRECVADALQASIEIDKLLRQLLDSAMTDAAMGSFVTETIEVAPLVDSLRRRMKAFVGGRDIRVSVFSSREAPARVTTDRLVFDRVIDNLLSNAAKYTQRGSIVVELGGAPGMLCLKVSDTGTGISEDRIDKVFGPGEAGTSEHPDSHGVGLAGVVRLLARLNGRLEVMSKPGVGTTFWAYVPVEPPDHTLQPSDDLRTMMGRVVRIRRSLS
jgi:signal transduction histidine kinase